MFTILAYIAGGFITYKIFTGMEKNTSETWDKYTNARIGKLHPKIRDDFRASINECDRKGMKVRLASGYRSFEEQRKIYAKGRTAPGKIISMAKPGQSYHNYALAGDVVEIKGGKALWKNPNWDKIGGIFEKHGFTWGGRWTKFLDRPHMQKTFGYHWSKLLNKLNNKDYKNGFVNI